MTLARTSLDLTFLICKMGMIISNSKKCVRLNKLCQMASNVGHWIVSLLLFFNFSLCLLVMMNFILEDF